MLKFKNNIDTAELDILGDIGESWFEDETTSMQAVKQFVNENKGKVLNVNISSLGGDVFHALAIYDLLKMHDSLVNVKIFGATASSGTIIAMAGNTVEMSENAFFLIHNVWTVAMGNANELEKTVEDLRMIDGKLVDLYQKRINKSGKNKKKSEILSLMEDEKWIDATEALAWGFIDSVIKDGRTINNSVRKQINNSNYLPKLENMNLLEKFRNLVGISDENATDEVVFAKVEQLKNELEAKEAELAEKTAEVEQLKSDLQTAVEATQTVEQVEEAKNVEIQAKVDELTAFQAKYEALELEHNTLKAQKSTPVASGDPLLQVVTVEPSASAKAAKQAISGLEHLIPTYAKKS